MNIIKIKCPQCGETIQLTYQTSLGHALTDEALAIDTAIKAHQCKAAQA